MFQDDISFPPTAPIGLPCMTYDSMAFEMKGISHAVDEMHGSEWAKALVISGRYIWQQEGGTAKSLVKSALKQAQEGFTKEGLH